MAFKNILVPLDLSERSLNALNIALDMAGKEETAKVTLLHVIETIDGADEDEFSAFYKKLAKRAQEKMEKISVQYGAENPNIDKKIVMGKRVREIVRFVYENQVDLVILSSHRIEKADSAEGWATISYRVGILAPCPVMMVK